MTFLYIILYPHKIEYSFKKIQSFNNIFLGQCHTNLIKYAISKSSDLE